MAKKGGIEKEKIGLGECIDGGEIAGEKGYEKGGIRRREWGKERKA